MKKFDLDWKYLIVLYLAMFVRNDARKVLFDSKRSDLY